MKKLTFLIINPNKKSTKQFSVPVPFVRLAFVSSSILSLFLGYFVMDYRKLRLEHEDYEKLLADQNAIKSEAKALSDNLDTVKVSLRRVEN